MISTAIMDSPQMNNITKAGDRFFGQMIAAGVADNDFIVDIVTMFLEEGIQSLNKLKKGVANKDQENTKRFAHKLKSSFLMFDMVRAHKIAVELENVDFTKKEVNIESSVKELQGICEVTFEQLRLKYLNQ